MKNVKFDSQTNAVIAKFCGSPSLDEFKEKAYAVLDLIEEKNLTKALNDTSKLEVISVENQEWTQTEWFPKAQELGLRHFAFLVSDNVFGEVSTQQANEKAEEEGIIDIKYFNSEEEAKAWLMSV